MNFKHKLISDTMATVLWMVAYVFVVPLFFYMKRRAQNTKSYNLILFWLHRKELAEHQIFDKILNLNSIRVPFNVISLGKKLVFGDMIELEATYLNRFLKKFIMRIIQEDPSKSRLWNFFHYLKNTELLNSKKLITKLLNSYEEHIKLLPGIIFADLIDGIEIKQTDLIRYLRMNRETLELSEEELIDLRYEIRLRKMRKLVNKYEEMMLVYRCQIIKNLVCQLESDKPPHMLLEDVFNNSFLPVIQNAQETLALKINTLNGEFKTIIYKGHRVL